MMALSTAPFHKRRYSPPPSSTGGRGRPETVTMRTTTFVAVLAEGIALAQEVLTGAERIQTAAAVGSRQLVCSEAGRLGSRAQGYRERFRQMASELDR